MGMAPNLKSETVEKEKDVAEDSRSKREREVDADEKDLDKSNKHSKIDSKLKDEALEASLSSSRVLSKRTRSEVGGSDDETEMPDQKKNYFPEEGEKSKTPSKLQGKELEASLSSSHSKSKSSSKVLKSASLSTSKNHSPAKRKSGKSEDVVSKEEEDLSTSSPADETLDNLEFISRRTRKGNSDNDLNQNNEKILSKSKSSQLNIIKLSDLKEDKKLRRKRLNKMLTIFSDQKCRE